MATFVRGGRKEPLADCSGWTAEFFIPFALLTGLAPNPPSPGTQWRGDFYRIDYDLGVTTHYAWCNRTSPNFHATARFGTLEFS